MKKTAWTVALLLMGGVPSGAQETPKPAGMDVEGIFSLIQARCARTQTARLSFTQTLSMMGQTMTTEGEGTLRRGDRNHFVTRTPTPMGEATNSVISDGQVMWQVAKMPMGLQVLKFDLTAMETGAVAQLIGLGPWGLMDAGQATELKKQTLFQNEVRVAGRDTVSGTPVYVVELTPRSGAPGGPMPVHHTQVRLGAEDGFVRAMDGYDRAGNVLVHFALKNLTFDVETPDSLFAYTPPPGVPVGDGNAMMKKMADMKAQQTGVLQKEAPDFALKAPDGTEVSLKSLRGKTVLIDFWASWCGPCRKALPHVQKIHEDFKGKGLVVLGINSESADAAQQFVKENGYTFTTLADDGGKVSALYKVQGIPTTVIVDKDGIVRSYTVGYGPEEEVRAALAKAGVQ